MIVLEITTKEEFDVLWENDHFLSNVCWDKNDKGQPIEYRPIDWDKEFIKKIQIDNYTTKYERVKY